MRTGYTFGLKLDCERNGCQEKFGFIHTDNGRIYEYEIDSTKLLASEEEILAGLIDPRVMDHACTVVARRPDPEWREITDYTAVRMVKNEWSPPL